MNKNFFIMGAPNAGKSTYLAALWHSINQKGIATSLTLKKMTGDLQYLYQLEHKWLEIEQLERTVIGQEKTELVLLLTDGECELKLEFPDLSGETFQNTWGASPRCGGGSSAPCWRPAGRRSTGM